MGGILGNVERPYAMMMLKALTIKGTFMYTRQQADELIRLVETGALPIGKRDEIEIAGNFPLRVNGSVPFNMPTMRWGRKRWLISCQMGRLNLM